MNAEDYQYLLYVAIVVAYVVFKCLKSDKKI